MSDAEEFAEIVTAYEAEDADVTCHLWDGRNLMAECGQHLGVNRDLSWHLTEQAPVLLAYRALGCRCCEKCLRRLEAGE